MHRPKTVKKGDYIFIPSYQACRGNNGFKGGKGLIVHVDATNPEHIKIYIKGTNIVYNWTVLKNYQKDLKSHFKGQQQGSFHPIEPLKKKKELVTY